MTGQDLGTGISNAIAGAGQGALQGAVAGGVMSGANKAFNKLAPKAAQAMQENVARNASYGDTMREQFKGAWNSGDSPVAERMKAMPEVIDNARTAIVNKNAVNRLANALEDAVDGGTTGNTKFVRISNDLLDELNDIRSENGLTPLTSRQVVAYENAINNNLINRVNEGMTAKDVAAMAFNALTSDNARAVPGYYENQLSVSEPGMSNDYDGVVIGRTENGGTSLKSIEPRSKSQIQAFENAGQQKIGPKSQLGSSPAEKQPVNNPIVSQNDQNVNSDSADNSALLSKSRFDNYDFNATVNNNNRRAMAIGLDPNKVSDEVYARDAKLRP